MGKGGKLEGGPRNKGTIPGTPCWEEHWTTFLSKQDYKIQLSLWESSHLEISTCEYKKDKEHESCYQ